MNGKGGAAIALANPVYLAVVDDATLRRVASDGIPSTSMPAFAQSAGGLLTEKQIDVIARGIRERWSKADALNGSVPPPYASTESGDAARGSRCTSPTASPVMASAVMEVKRRARLSTGAF